MSRQGARVRRIQTPKGACTLGRRAPARLEKRRCGKERPIMSVSQVTQAGLMLCWSVLFCIAYECRPAAAQPLSNGLGDLRVMTYNVYEGTDFLEVATAQSVEALLIAVGQTIAQVRATRPLQRMQALA